VSNPSMRWRHERLPLTKLRLDPKNPRLASGEQSELNQQDLLLELVNSANIYQVAESIANHGFFDSEPLIAVEESGEFTVVEGNRRLAALQILNDDALRSRLPKKTGAWASLGRGNAPDTVPVVVVRNRASVVPLLGYRHISGIEPWDPVAQARYIVNLVEDEELTLEEVAQQVGRPLTEVRSMYRNHEILRQADQEFGLDVTNAEKGFGVFTAAMGRPVLRSYISAPDPAQVDTNYWPLSDGARTNTATLLGYLFGEGSTGRGRVVTDSRQLKDLIEVLSDETGRGEQTLRRTRSLADALETVREPADKFITYLTSAIRAIGRAENVAPDVLDRRSLGAIKEIQDGVQRLLADQPPGAVR